MDWTLCLHRHQHPQDRLVACRVLAARRFLRAVLVYKRQPRETQLLQDLVAGFIYICAVLAIIAYVFDCRSAACSPPPACRHRARPGLAKHPGRRVLGHRPQPCQTLSSRRLGDPGWRHAGTRHRDELAGNADPDRQATTWRSFRTASSPRRNSSMRASRRGPRHHHHRQARTAVAPSRGCAALEAALLSCNRILRTPAPSVMVRSARRRRPGMRVQFFVAEIDDASRRRRTKSSTSCSGIAPRRAFAWHRPPGSSFALPPSAASASSGGHATTAAGPRANLRAAIG